MVERTLNRDKEDFRTMEKEFSEMKEMKERKEKDLSDKEFFF